MRNLFTALACLAVVAACTPSAPPVVEPWEMDTMLVTNMGGEPDVIDPQKASFANELSIIGMLYEPLLTWDARSLTLVPAAARALPQISDGGRTYTYILRQGLTYSDGTPLTAQRFVDAFVRLCDPNTVGEFTYLAFPIVGCQELALRDPKKTSAADLAAGRAAVAVTAPDALTVVFRLRAPFAAFPHVTAMPAGAPIRLEDIGPVPHPWGTTMDIARYVGNGPFVLTEWKHNEYMTFARNERYRLPVRLASWKKVMITDTDVERAAYEAGDLDVAAVAPRSVADREALLARSDLARTLGPCMRYVGFNTQRPPFDDPAVRMAFAKAIDKDAFAPALGLASHVAPSFVTHEFPGHAHGDRTQDFDPRRARELLASSKYGPPVDGKLAGMDLKFTFNDVPRDGSARRRIEWLIGQWDANLHVRVVPDAVDPTTSYGLVKRPQALPSLRWMTWCADYPDGDAWYENFTKDGAGARALAFFDPEYDAVAATAKAEPDPLARQRLYDAASARLSEDAPGAWIDWPERWWLISPKLRGYELSSFDWAFAQLSLARVVGSARASP